MTQPFRPPHKHGFSRGTITDARGVLPKPRLELGGAVSLQALNREYAFFTPAVLYLSGLFTDAPLIDYLQSVHPDVVHFYHHRFNAPIFRGLLAPDGDDAWNSVLWAVRRSFWQGLQDFMCSVVLVKSDSRLIVGVGYQEFEVLDPLATDRHRIVSADTAKIRVGAFGLNGNKYIFAFEFGDPFKSLPLVRRYHPSESLGVFAEALFAGKNPVDARTRKEASYGQAKG